MSIINSCANVRKVREHGLDKKVYYSKKYDVVLKFSRYDEALSNPQIDEEIKLWEKMTEKERYFFPIVQYLDYKGRRVIVMKHCYTFTAKDGYREFNIIADYLRRDASDLMDACEVLKIDAVELEKLREIIDKYNIQDVHPGNIGRLENRIVLIDGGIWG